MPNNYSMIQPNYHQVILQVIDGMIVNKPTNRCATRFIECPKDIEFAGSTLLGQSLGWLTITCSSGEVVNTLSSTTDVIFPLLTLLTTTQERLPHKELPSKRSWY